METRQALNALLSKDELSDTERKELADLTKRSMDTDIEMKAAIAAEPQLETREMVHGLDAEQRERLELRSQASLTNFLTLAT